MSYVPKYVLKRLIPEKAVKLVGGDIQVEMVNVLTPIPFSMIPGEFVDLVEIKVDDKVVVDSSKPEVAEKAKIIWNGKDYALKNIKEVADGTLPVGDKMTIVIPNIFGFKVGETHTMELTVKIDSPINIKFERTISE